MVLRDASIAYSSAGQSRPVSISKLEGALQDADGVVVGPFTPAVAIRDGNETRVSDV
jgi:hypothetical protein